MALGDGNLSKLNKRSVRLRVTCDLSYQNLISKISGALQQLFPTNKVSIVKRKRNCLDISLYSNSLETLLGWRSDRGSKFVQRVRVPEWIFRKRKYAVACLCGLIETDGSVYIDRGYKNVIFTTVIPDLAEDAVRLFNLIGFEPRIYKVEDKNLDFSKRHLPKYNIRLAKRVNEFLSVVPVVKS